MQEMKKSWIFPLITFPQKNKEKKININTTMLERMLIKQYLHIVKMVIQVQMKIQLKW